MESPEASGESTPVAAGEDTPAETGEDTPVAPGENVPLVVFVHIRKTAGYTMRHILHRQYRRRQIRQIENYFAKPEASVASTNTLAGEPPPGLRLLHGHFLLWPDVPWPEGTRFFTLIRDPVERVISQYFWSASKQETRLPKMRSVLAAGRIPDNLQTRVLAGSDPPFGETTEAMLEQALANLERFAAVGVTEWFDESLLLFTHAFEWHPLLYRRANVTEKRKRREEIPSKVLRLIERQNALDLELHRYARQRLKRDLAVLGDEFKVNLEVLKRGNARLASTQGGAPAGPAIVESATAATDLRERLIDAKATLLLHRELRYERMREEEGETADSVPSELADFDDEGRLEERVAILEAKFRRQNGDAGRSEAQAGLAARES